MANQLVKHLAIENVIYDIADEYCREKIEDIEIPTMPIKWAPVSDYIEVSSQAELYHALEQLNNTEYDLRIHINRAGSYTLAQRNGDKSTFTSLVLHLFSTVAGVELDMADAVFYNCHINAGGNNDNTRLKVINSKSNRSYYDNSLVNYQYTDFYCAYVQYGNSGELTNCNFYDTEQNYSIRISEAVLSLYNPQILITNVSNKSNYDFAQIYTSSKLLQRGNLTIAPLTNKASGTNRLFNLGWSGTATGSELIIDGSARNSQTGAVYEEGEGTYDLALTMFKATLKSNQNGFNYLKNVATSPSNSMILQQCELITYQSY